MNGNYNPLQDMTWEQLQYLYDNTEVGSTLRSNVASQLSALQASRQREIEKRDKK